MVVEERIERVGKGNVVDDEGIGFRFFFVERKNNLFDFI